ncbi:MAG: hypothetical protein ABIK94_03325 [candidate division WOR-3 bacterium]
MFNLSLLILLLFSIEVKELKWIDPLGRKPKSYEEWLNETFTKEKTRIGNVYQAGKENLCAIIVNAEIYPDLVLEINQFVSDLQNEGWAVRVDTIRGLSHTQLRNHLASLNNLKGAIFIGEVPVAWCESYGFGVEEYPIDLYFMDLNGNWVDSDNDGKYDNHTGDVNPEIWVGRLYSRPLTWDSEIRLLKNYFYKNHLYRIGLLSVPRRALSYVDDDWQGFGDCSLSRVYTDVTVVETPSITTASDYRNRLRQGFEWIQVCAHSSPWGHTFAIPGGYSGTVFNSEIFALEPNALFFNLFACSGTRFIEENYSAGWYIFQNPYGLLAVGSSKVGSMLNFQDFYTPLGRDSCVGEAFKAWFIRNGQSSRSWFYGLNIMGDPTLKPNRAKIKRLGGNKSYSLKPGLDVEVVSPNSETDNAPAVLLSSDNKIWVAWTTGRNTTNGRFDIYSAYRDNSWQDVGFIGPHTYWDVCPALSKEGNGNPICVWSHFDYTNNHSAYNLYYSIYQNNSWSARQRFVVDSSCALNSSLVRDSNNFVRVFFQSRRRGNLDIFTSTFNGTNWSSPLPVTSNQDDDLSPKSLVAQNGRVWVFYNRYLIDGSKIFASFESLGLWYEIGPISGNQKRAYRPSATLEGNNRFWVTWQSFDDGNGNIYGAYWDGNNFSPPIRITLDTFNDLFCDMATDNQGRPFLVWQTNRDGNWNVYFSYYENGLWRTPQPVDLNTGVDIYPKILIRNDEVWVIWQNFFSNNWEIFAKMAGSVGEREERVRRREFESKGSLRRMEIGEEIYDIEGKKISSGRIKGSGIYFLKRKDGYQKVILVR